jgi:copper resistance protein D
VVDVSEPLIWLRAFHFAAAASLAGALLFQTLISDPAVRTAQRDGHIPAIARHRLARIVWISFALILATGAGWFVVQTAQMTDVAPSAVFAEGAAWNVLFNTDFGNVWVVRAVLAALFGAAFLLEAGRLTNFRASGAVSTALAMALVGSLAYAGHAAAGSDTEGAVHLSADISCIWSVDPRLLLRR